MVWQGERKYEGRKKTEDRRQKPGTVVNTLLCELCGKKKNRQERKDLGG